MADSPLHGSLWQEPPLSRLPAPVDTGDDAEEVPAEEVQPEPETVPAPELVPLELEVVDEPPPDYWTGEFEFGFDGSEGNSQIANLRTGFELERKTEVNRFHTDFYYLSSQNGGVKTARNLRSESRFEWNWGKTRWK